MDSLKSRFFEIAKLREKADIPLNSPCTALSKLFQAVRHRDIQNLQLLGSLLAVSNDDWDSFTTDERAIILSYFQVVETEGMNFGLSFMKLLIWNDLMDFIQQLLAMTVGSVLQNFSESGFTFNMQKSPARYPEKTIFLLADGFPFDPNYHCEWISTTSYPLPAAEYYVLKGIENISIWDVFTLFRGADGKGAFCENAKVVLEHGQTLRSRHDSMFRLAHSVGLKITEALTRKSEVPEKILPLDVETDLDDPSALTKKMHTRTIVLDASDKITDDAVESTRLHRLFCEKRSLNPATLHHGMYGVLNVPVGHFPAGTEVNIKSVQHSSNEVGQYTVIPMGMNETFTVSYFVDGKSSIQPLRYVSLRSRRGLASFTERRFDHVIVINPDDDANAKKTGQQLCLKTFLEIM